MEKNHLFKQNKKAKPETYDATDIEVLEGLEPVRKRPGMYIGGTDERAVHHLVAEVLDNSMDEAVAGHATLIEIELYEDFSIKISDNGRGIPTDKHPKFPNKSALEVILCTLHAGGKFSGKAYQTSGGLHGVGISVVNALSSSLEVEVVRNKELFTQSYKRGLPITKLINQGPIRKHSGTQIKFTPDFEIFGEMIKFKPSRLFKMIQSKAYLFSGVEIYWKCSEKCLTKSPEVPNEAKFHYPNGLIDYLKNSLIGETTYCLEPFSGNLDFGDLKQSDSVGSVEWAVNWAPTSDGFLLSYCNTVNTSDGGTHETGFWNALIKGIKSYGELTGHKKSVQITRDDLVTGACGIISLFIREPEFVGQTKDRLASSEATRLVENAVRERFENWLANDPKSANLILEYMLNRMEERQRRKSEKETQRKSAVKKLRLPGKLADCSSTSGTETELFLVEGDSAGGSAKQARNRTNQAILPLRGKILNVLSATVEKMNQNQEIIDLCKALGVGVGSKFQIDDLRYDRIIIMTDADVDGEHIASLLMTFFFTQMQSLVELGHLFLAVPPLYRISKGAQSYYAQDEKQKEEILKKYFSGKGKVEVSRFKGLGEMNPKQLKETTMDPSSRKLIRIGFDKDTKSDTFDLIETLMGKNAEPRFKYITENAKFLGNINV